jgi:hypothetical protein
MPVVIKELLIKAVVTKPAEDRPSALQGQFNLAKLKKEIKRECIDAVMEKIREQKER